jgi:hypothetical protein
MWASCSARRWAEAVAGLQARAATHPLRGRPRGLLLQMGRMPPRLAGPVEPSSSAAKLMPIVEEMGVEMSPQVVEVPKP